LLGKKIGMTQIFNKEGNAVPVTVIQIEDALVVDKKTDEKDGYNALKIGYIDEKKPKNVPKPIKGIFKNEKKKIDLPLKRFLKEIKVDKEDIEKYKIGDVITIEAIKDVENKKVDITGITKGKGTQGVVKRWGFSGGGASHGSMSHRRPGSIGSNTFPAHVWKNKKMAGRMGGNRFTVLNLKVEKVDVENKFILVRGTVPGNKNELVYIRKSVKEKK
jgi:large subunit ribosomal protein L3